MVEYSYNGYGLPSSSVNSSYITIASKLEEANVLLYNDISYLDPENIGGLNLYAYCGSNPVMMVDPSGHFFISSLIIGALVGIAIGGGFSIGTQLIASKGDWSQINWMQVGLDAAIGGISGLVAATGIGVLGSAIFGGVLGFGGSVGGDLIANNGDWSQINWGKAIIMGVLGAGIGVLCGSGAQNVDDLGRGLMNNSSIKSQFTR